MKFLLRVTMRRHDLAAEIYHIKEPVKLALVMSRNEAERLLAMAGGLKIRVMLALGYGCGLRAGEAVCSAGCEAGRAPARRPLRRGRRPAPKPLARTTACAAASRAIGTRNGEQDT